MRLRGHGSDAAKRRGRVICRLCTAPAILDRLPGRISGCPVHQFCWPCAKRYSFTGDAHRLARAQVNPRRLVVIILRSIPGWIRAAR